MASELLHDNGNGERLVREAVDELERLRLVWVEEDKVFGLGTPVETARKHANSGWKWRWNSLAR